MVDKTLNPEPPKTPEEKTKAKKKARDFFNVNKDLITALVHLPDDSVRINISPAEVVLLFAGAYMDQQQTIDNLKTRIAALETLLGK